MFSPKFNALDKPVSTALKSFIVLVLCFAASTAGLTCLSSGFGRFFEFRALLVDGPDDGTEGRLPSGPSVEELGAM